MDENGLLEKVYWRSPEDILALSHGGQIPMDLIPPGIRGLGHTPIAHQLAVMAMIRDAAGQVIGLHTEIETFPKAGGAEFEVYLTVVIAGRGALVVRELKSYGGTALQQPMAVAAEQGEWIGELEVIHTTGPEPGGFGRVIAATGDFAGLTGIQRQVSVFRRLTPRGAQVENCEWFWLRRA